MVHLTYESVFGMTVEQKRDERQRERNKRREECRRSGTHKIEMGLICSTCGSPL